MSEMSKYSLVGVVLLLSANRFVETTPNSSYGKDCHVTAAVFTPTNSNCFHFVIGINRKSNKSQKNQNAGLQLSAKSTAAQKALDNVKNRLLKYNNRNFAKF